MKILLVSDTPHSAIDILAESIVKFNPHLEIRNICLHPKRPDLFQIEQFEQLAKDTDIIHWMYVKSMYKAKEISEIARIHPKQILTHHNEYNYWGGDKLGEGDLKTAQLWKERYNLQSVVVVNNWLHNELPGSELIHLGIDSRQFPFQEYTKEKTVGYCGQLKKEKGIREIALACKDLGYKFIVVSNRISKPEYWEEVDKTVVEFNQNVPPIHLNEMYKKMAVYVCNSWDGIESGTMPVMEAMFSGVPVISRPVGITRELIQDNETGIVNKFGSHEIDKLKELLRGLMEDEEKRKKIREKAWNKVKGYDVQYMAKKYYRLYRRVWSDKPFVSVIIPTYKREENVKKIIEALKEGYENIEIIIINDDEKEVNFRDDKLVIKNLETDNKGYGLAQARNMGVVEADGDILVFLDDRMCPDKNAIQSFVDRLISIPFDQKIWLFGDKGSQKETFVENFSAVKRQNIINAGMFSERINAYGGMSQEIRIRYNRQGFKFEYLTEAKAIQLSSSHKNPKRRQDIINSKYKLWKMGMEK